MNIVYFARFCQLIFSYCFPDIPMPEDDVMLPLKITKRAFTDLIKKDSKKSSVPALIIPVTIQDALKQAQPDTYNSIFSADNQPHHSTSEPQNISSSGHSQKGPVVKSDRPSPKRTRTLRSSQSSQTAPPLSSPRKRRRFFQRISDSDEDT